MEGLIAAEGNGTSGLCLKYFGLSHSLLHGCLVPSDILVSFKMMMMMMMMMMMSNKGYD